MDLLTRLRSETSARHQQTEALLYADKLMNGTLTRIEYEHLLAIHHLFHQSLEAAVAAQVVATQTHFFAGYDRELRRKTPWLMADLQGLGLPLPDVYPGLFANWNGYQLLGALYVAEGSTLGGRVIANALRRTSGLGDVAAKSRFFGGYGEQIGPLWKAFGTYLTGRADGHDEVIIGAAIGAFDRFQQVATQIASPVLSN